MGGFVYWIKTRSDQKLSIEILCTALHSDPSPQIRALSAQTLVKLGMNREIANALQESLQKESDEVVRNAIIQAISDYHTLTKNKKMSDLPKVQMNFNAPVYGVAGNVEGDQIINTVEPETLADIKKILANYPKVTNVEAAEIIDTEFIQIQSNNPQRWQKWMDIFSVAFAGGTESVKILAPAIGIPIEVMKRLYEIYQRNRSI
jgi:HEAT repeats